MPLLAASAIAGGACARPADAGSRGTAKDASAGALVTLTIEDIRREMQSAKGRVLFVHMWATWCLPCLEELPRIDRFVRAAQARGAVVLALSVDSDYRDIARITTVLRERAPGLNAAVAHFDEPDRFMSLFDKSWRGSIPALFAFDAEGKLQRTLLGGARQAGLDALLDELLPPSKGPAAAVGPPAR